MNANLHRRTPSLLVIDSRGLPLRQVAYLRALADEPAVALVTRQQHDMAGHLVAQFDPRLNGPTITHLNDLNGQPLKVSNVDAGWRLSLPGLAGQILQRWDARGVHWRNRYDELLRLVSISNSADPLSDTFTYAGASAPADHNQRGRLLEQFDPSGTLHLDSYSLTGQLRCERRTFTDAREFVTQRIFSPLDAVLEQTDAGGHRQQSRYDLAGQLKHLQLLLAGHNTWQAVLLDAHFNAAGQIIAQHAGNGVSRYWRYEPDTGLVQRQWAQKGAQQPLQDFEHEYDPVGNPTRILDHAFTPRHFANQRVDGERTFSYDSLYRLISASGYDDAAPGDIPGRPQPSDPNDRRNYLQTYTYDHGGNLTQLCHVRDGACQTRLMRIDAASNRGVRWKEGDPAPDFAQLFDRHGNLMALQPGQTLRWDARDQLASVTLVQRENGADDAEFYHYSQGVRVYKRHDTYSGSTRHFHEVRYLPGLEIRSKDNAEQLHVISLASGGSHAVCLHWLSGKPPGVADNQLRYTLNDHLGSCVMELDQQARLISHEGYYPFGATAWMSANSAVEVDYKTLRYSGKEMDVSGLYYYGARYYAPWLQRWVSADPAGDVDGPNRFAFVGNNPLRYVDPDGNNRAESVIMLYSAFLSSVQGHSTQVAGQIHNILHEEGVAMNLALNMAGEVVRGVVGYEGGVAGGKQVDLIMPNVPGTTPYTTTGGVIGGNIGGDSATAMIDPIANSAGLRTGPLIPQTSQISVKAIDHGLGIRAGAKEISSWRNVKDELIHPGLDAVLNPSFIMGRLMASWISIIPAALNMFARAIEAEDIKNRLDPVKIKKIDTMLDDWKSAVEQRAGWAENAFDALGTDIVYPANSLPNINHMTSAETLTPISRSDLRRLTRFTLSNIKRSQDMMTAYKAMGTTDNQFLLAQRRTRKKAA